MKVILRERQAARERARAWITFAISHKHFLALKHKFGTVYTRYKKEVLRQRSARRIQILFLQAMRARALHI